MEGGPLLTGLDSTGLGLRRGFGLHGDSHVNFQKGSPHPSMFCEYDYN